jgi:adenosine kinase
MPALVCGSLAFDSIATFPGRFADQILANQLHVLNVSFLVPTLRRELAAAPATSPNLAALGGEPVVLAALGSDGDEYLARLRSWGTTTEYVRPVGDSLTAQAFIITDLDNNQITAFHPGAMQAAHETPVPTRDDLRLAIIAPDGRAAMLEHAQQLAAAKIPFILDPGQGLPMFDGAELSAFVERASWVAVNDYEAQMLADRTGQSIEAMSRSHLRGIVVTLGALGCELWQQGVKTTIPGVAATEVIDPTGCGDAFRAAMLYGLEKGWPLADCARLGNRLGALKIASRGGQNHVLDRTFAGA